MHNCISFVFLLCLFVVFVGCESMQAPKISVVIPIYNMQSWISICLISVLNQTYQNIELICVDDGSKDKSLQILNYFAKYDKRVKIIHQENCGLPCALNTGLLASIGEYVTFVDADDWIDFDLYEVAIGKIKEYDLDVVSWGCVFVNEDDRLLNSCSEDKILRGDDAGRFLLPSTPGPVSVWSRMYRHSMLKDNNILFKPIHRGNDLLFNFDLVPVVDSVFCLSYPFYHYNMMPTGMFSTYTPEDGYELAQALIEHLTKLKNTTAYNNRMTEKESDWIYSLAMQFMSIKSEVKNKVSVSYPILLYILIIISFILIFIFFLRRKKMDKMILKN